MQTLDMSDKRNLAVFTKLLTPPAAPWPRRPDVPFETPRGRRRRGHRVDLRPLQIQRRLTYDATDAPASISDAISPITPTPAKTVGTPTLTPPHHSRILRIALRLQRRANPTPTRFKSPPTPTKGRSSRKFRASLLLLRWPPRFLIRPCHRRQQAARPRARPTRTSTKRNRTATNQFTSALDAVGSRRSPPARRSISNQATAPVTPPLRCTPKQAKRSAAVATLSALDH